MKGHKTLVAQGPDWELLNDDRDNEGLWFKDESGNLTFLIWDEIEVIYRAAQKTKERK